MLFRSTSRSVANSLYSAPFVGYLNSHSNAPFLSSVTSQEMQSFRTPIPKVLNWVAFAVDLFDALFDHEGVVDANVVSVSYCVQFFGSFT